jgi:hypothetical protein
LKIALIIDNGEATFVLTPDNPAEKGILDLVAPEGAAQFMVTRGQLYQTRGNTLTIAPPNYTTATENSAFFRPVKRNDDG